MEGAMAERKPHPGTMTVNVTVNRKSERLAVEPRMTLLDALREELALTGTKRL
jgi:xanthine dehydrogenase YagT iron-sulfur-binding subunit